MINRAGSDLFGRHVTNGSHHGARICMDLASGDVSLANVRGGWLAQLGKTKVENHYASAVGEKEIVGFQVAVDNSFFVSSGKAMSNLNCVVCSFARWYWSIGEQVSEVFPFE